MKAATDPGVTLIITPEHRHTDRTCEHLAHPTARAAWHVEAQRPGSYLPTVRNTCDRHLVTFCKELTRAR